MQFRSTFYNKNQALFTMSEDDYISRMYGVDSDDDTLHAGKDRRPDSEARLQYKWRLHAVQRMHRVALDRALFAGLCLVAFFAGVTSAASDGRQKAWRK